MEKLNELAAGIKSGKLSASWVAVDSEHILTIAEAFRALEQRAESAEAKLAELEKQEPRHFYREHNSYNGMKTDWTEVSAEQLEHLKEITDPDTSEIIELFTRAAPAADLAELVPIRAPIEVISIIENSVNGPVYDEGVQAIWSGCIDTILRNIEEAK